MIDQLELDLIPYSIKQQMKTMRRVSFYTVGCIFVLYIAMLLYGIFHDMVAAITLLLLLLLITVPWLLPGFRFDKINQSRVCLMTDCIRILDKSGNCWRTIDYSTISDVREEDISGFFYGENKNLYREKYICVYLNELTEIPSVSFAKLFAEKDFIMFSYRPEALQWIQQKLSKTAGDNYL